MSNRTGTVMGSALFIIFLLALFVGLAGAQPMPRCGDRAEIARILLDKYQEVPTSSGMTKDGKALEVLISPSGTWTVLISHPDGMSCIAAVGADWEMGTAPVAEEAS